MNKNQLDAKRQAIRVTYRELYQPASLIALCESYLKHAPLDGVVWAWYGHTLIEMGRHGEADTALKTARGLVTTDEHKAFTLACRAELEESRGRLAEAEGLFREGLAIAPGDQWMLLKLGRILFRQGRPSEAEHCFRCAAELDGNRKGNALYELGQALRARGALFEARRVLKYALALVPESELAGDALADIDRAMRLPPER
jgi:tetratricopeptide (TPR) repeat protein